MGKRWVSEVAVIQARYMGIWDNWETAFHLWKYETERGTQLDQRQDGYLSASCNWYVCLLVSHEVVSRRCFCLTVGLSAELGRSTLVQGPMLMLCRSVLLSFAAGLSILNRKMIFPLTKAARTGGPVLGQMWSEQCSTFFIRRAVLFSKRSAFVLPASQ